MDVKDRITSISTYFKEMQVTNIDGENIIYVIVKFPFKWIIDDNIQKDFNVSVQAGNEKGEFYFCTDIENGFDTVFDAIESNIEKMKNAEERAELLKNKVVELRSLFEDETITLEALRTLEFSFSQPKKSRKPKFTNIAKKEETVLEETVDSAENNDSED